MADLSMTSAAMTERVFYQQFGSLYGTPAATASQTAALETLNRGYQRFLRGGYVTPQGIVSVHQWSFLFPTGTAALVDSTATVALAAGFGGFIESPAYAYAADNDPIVLTRTSPEAIRAEWAKDNTEGQPRRYAVEPITLVAATGQRFQMILAPVPDTNYTVNVRFRVLPDVLTYSTSVYPYGGADYSDVIVQSALAVNERDTTGIGAMEQSYQQLMREAVAIDDATFGKHSVENRYDFFDNAPLNQWYE